MDKSRIALKRLARIAIFTSLIVAQEELLSFIPNVQFTQVLIAVYFYSFGLVDTLIIVSLHVLLDNLIFGSFNLVYTPAMFIGWISLVLILYMFRNKDNRLLVSIIVALHSVIYSFCFVLANHIFTNTSFIAYFISDIPFEIILIVNGFVTTFILFDPLTKVLKQHSL